MRIYWLVGMFVFAAFCAADGQQRERREPGPLLPIAQDGKMGYIDRTGKIVISPQFAIPTYMGEKILSDFTEGLAPIKEHDKWGFIDLSGKVIITPQFDWVTYFQEGIAAVQVKKRYGYIDKAGQIIIAPQFANLGLFSEGLAPVLVGKKWGYIDKTGKLAVPPQFDDASVFKDGIASVSVGRQYSHINPAGGIIGHCLNECVGLFWEGLAKIRTNYHFGIKERYGYMDRSGAVVIKPQFDEANDFSEGIALVKLDPTEERAIPVTDRFFFFIDRAGARISKDTFYWAEDFSEGLAAVQKERGKKKGYIDNTGRTVIAPKYDEAWPFQNGIARVLINSKWGYIDKSGAFVWEPSK